MLARARGAARRARRELEVHRRVQRDGHLRALKGTCFYRLEAPAAHEFAFFEGGAPVRARSRWKTASCADATTITQDYTSCGGSDLARAEGCTLRDAAAAAKAAITDGEEGEGEWAHRCRTTHRGTSRRSEDEAEVLAQFYGNGTTCASTGWRESEVRQNMTRRRLRRTASVEEVLIYR